MFGSEDIINYRIKNNAKFVIGKDFGINPVNFLIFTLFVIAGFIFEYQTGGIKSVYDFLILLVFPLMFYILFFVGIWEGMLTWMFLTILIMFFWKWTQAVYFLAFIISGAVIAPVFQMLKEWERAILLRLGKFKKVKGPGLFFILPFCDSLNRIVDLRIRVTDFVAETTLTKDSVTVTVDALCFWLVWDAEKAVCEVENYVEAVVLSSQTALRSAISVNTLSTLLNNSEAIEDHIRAVVDKKTIEWGITIQHIEITDIKLPQELQDSMSRLAQAEREKMSRILISEAEVGISKKLEEAAKTYENNPIALKLKNLSIINEGFRNGNSMIVVPSDLSQELGKEDIFGIKALSEIKKSK